MRNVELFKDYENAKIMRVEEYQKLHAARTYRYDSLGEQDVAGIPICLTRAEDGHLDVTFIPDTHLLAIGSTRSGKTSGFVIPTLNVLLKKKNKPSLVISDPKKELYASNAAKFIAEGYRVILLDFTDYKHSDCWNPLTGIFRLYQKYLHVEDTVELIKTKKGLRNRFDGRLYDDQKELDLDIAEIKQGYLAEVDNRILMLSRAIVPVMNERDPYWETSAQDLLCGILYGMLEDSEKGLITEDNFSLDTVIRIFDSFTDSVSSYDRGYFSDRDLKSSKAYQIVQKCILEQANNTRRCISSSFAAKISKFRDTCVNRITCTNTFEIRELDNGSPTVIFVSYKDEEGSHYEVISMFLSDLYTELIGVAREKGAKLERPFYFLLDEFGNLPRFNDFDKVISACGGRNIWFLLVLQSYAQLNNIYGEATAKIIKDNLNAHIFFGTNNPETKKEFSHECGEKTILSPTSALNGSGESISHYAMDTVSLVPVSALTHIPEGECIVTQMREDVLWSRIERYYWCPEFAGEISDPKQRGRVLKFSDPKYHYEMPVKDDDKENDRKNPFDF